MPMPNETHDWDAIRERMQKRLDEGYPPAWLPEEVGEELVGVVVAIKPAVRTQYGPCPVVTVVTPGTGTKYSVWLTHVVLKQEFVRQRPEPGEAIALRYEGEVRPEGGGAAYENYSLVVDRPEEQGVDWEAISRRYKLDAPDEDDDRRPLEQRTETLAGGAAADEDDIPF
jgi:hypothetical protein